MQPGCTFRFEAIEHAQDEVEKGMHIQCQSVWATKENKTDKAGVFITCPSFKALIYSPRCRQRKAGLTLGVCVCIPPRVTSHERFAVMAPYHTTSAINSTAGFRTLFVVRTLFVLYGPLSRIQKSHGSLSFKKTRYFFF